MKLDMGGNRQSQSLYVPQEGAMLCGKENIILTPCDIQESNSRVISPSEAACKK